MRIQVRTILAMATAVLVGVTLIGCAATIEGNGLPVASGITLVNRGRPKAFIVVTAAAMEKDAKDPTARKIAGAARELQTYIEKISGATLPIVADTRSMKGPLILVGRSRLTDAMGVKIPEGVTHSRREEGFVIVCRDNRLVLAGNNDGPYRGTEYAVYAFLERLGVRWFMPGEFGESVPRMGTIRFAKVQIVEKPDFVKRIWWGGWTPRVKKLDDQNRAWKLRMRMSTGDMFAIPSDGSVESIVDPGLFKTRPELFAMNLNGTRNPHAPSYSHPGAVQVAARIIKEHFRKYPDRNSFGFSPHDGYPRDYDPQTLKLHQGFVQLGGRPGVPRDASSTEEWITFANNVAREVRKDFPHVYIATNGYANRDIPPEGMDLDDHMVIMFAPIWCCTLHAYDDPHCWQKVRQGQMLKRWCELSDNVLIYGYPYNMLVSGLTPLPEFTKLRRDFALMKKWGVMGFLDETREVLAECGIASRYLRARLYWNADADVDAILDDFFDKWYGAAAGSAKAFWFALDEAVANTPMHGHEDRIMPEVYTPALLRQLDRHIAEAEKLADTKRTRLHVRADRLTFEHLEAYMALSAARRAGDYAEVIRQGKNMLEIRGKTHAINPWYFWHDESSFSGVWDWTITDRMKFYQGVLDRISGKTGDLVAMLPEKAMFRTDPHDDGKFERWHEPGFNEKGWQPILTTRPFFVQDDDLLNERGHPYVGFIWYRLKAHVPESTRGRKVKLYVPTLATEAWAWVNGQYVGHRPYQESYIRPAHMEVDVTDAIRPGQTNVIAIRVSTNMAPAQAAEGLLSRVVLYAPK